MKICLFTVKATILLCRVQITISFDCTFHDIHTASAAHDPSLKASVMFCVQKSLVVSLCMQEADPVPQVAGGEEQTFAKMLNTTSVDLVRRAIDLRAPNTKIAYAKKQETYQVSLAFWVSLFMFLFTKERGFQSSTGWQL